MKKFILIICVVFVIGFSGASVAKKDSLGDFLKSNCIVLSDSKLKTTSSCNPQQVLKDLPLAFDLVILEVYGDSKIISYSITPSMQSDDSFYEGKVESNEVSYIRKGDLIERHLSDGCIIIDKVIKYGNGNIAMKSMGSKGFCTGSRKLSLERLKGKTLEHKTISIE